MKRRQSPARRVLPFVSIVTFLGFLDTHLLIPVMALYAAELGAGVGIIGIVIGLYSITNTPANILFGRLIDRIGSKFPLTVGLVADALGMFLYSICRLPVHLALVRAFHGISGGLVGPATMSFTAEHTTETKRAKAMGIYGISLATATLVGYGLSGLIVSRLGYTALFLLGAALLIVGAAISLLLPGNGYRKSKLVETVASAASQQVLTTETQPAMDIKWLLRRRGLIIVYCSIFAQYFTFGGVVTLLPLYVKGMGMEAFHVGMLLATFAIMFIIVQFPSGAISDKAGRLTPIVIGLSLGVIALIALPTLKTFTMLAVAMGLYGTAYGILFPSISALVIDSSTTGERGLATGIFHALITTGVAVGAPVMGFVSELVGVQPGLAATAGVMVLALAITLVISKNLRSC